MPAVTHLMLSERRGKALLTIVPPDTFLWTQNGVTTDLPAIELDWKINGEGYRFADAERESNR